MRICSQCKEELEEEKFYSGRTACKSCIIRKNTEYKRRNREKVNTQKREYYRLNPDKVKASNKKWYENNKEKRSEYHKEYLKTVGGKESVHKSLRKYQDSNRDKLRIWNIAKVIKITECEMCGEEGQVRHHPDYSKPLEVMCLCRKCHKKIHLTLNKQV